MIAHQRDLKLTSLSDQIQDHGSLVRPFRYHITLPSLWYSPPSFILHSRHSLPTFWYYWFILVLFLDRARRSKPLSFELRGFPFPSFPLFLFPSFSASLVTSPPRTRVSPDIGKAFVYSRSLWLLSSWWWSASAFTPLNPLSRRSCWPILPILPVPPKVRKQPHCTNAATMFPSHKSQPQRPLE